MDAQRRHDDPADVRLLYPLSDRSQRRYLGVPVRYALVSLMGILVAGASFYLLRKVGY